MASYSYQHKGHMVNHVSEQGDIAARTQFTINTLLLANKGTLMVTDFLCVCRTLVRRLFPGCALDHVTVSLVGHQLAVTLPLETNISNVIRFINELDNECSLISAL